MISAWSPYELPKISNGPYDLTMISLAILQVTSSGMGDANGAIDDATDSSTLDHPAPAPALGANGIGTASAVGGGEGVDGEGVDGEGVDGEGVVGGSDGDGGDGGEQRPPPAWDGWD